MWNNYRYTVVYRNDFSSNVERLLMLKFPKLVTTYKSFLWFSIMITIIHHSKFHSTNSNLPLVSEYKHVLPFHIHTSVLIPAMYTGRSLFNLQSNLFPIPWSRRTNGKEEEIRDSGSKFPEKENFSHFALSGQMLGRPEDQAVHSSSISKLSGLQQKSRTSVAQSSENHINWWYWCICSVFT